MKYFQSLSLAVALAASTLGSVGAFAADLASGEIRKIDKDSGKITIRHGEIKSLDMPPMTMVFAVKTPALLDSFKSGDKILFQAVSENGKMVVTEMQAAK